MGSPDGELSILLVDDSRIADLNEKYLHRTGPTNVIAFPMRDDKFPDISPQLLGDVVISVDTAIREADAAGLEIDRRISELLVHGILHLFGYDHERGGEKAREMEEKTRELLERMEST